MHLHSALALACWPGLLACPACSGACLGACLGARLAGQQYGVLLRSAPAQTLSTARLRSAPVWNTGIHSMVTSFQCIDCDTNQARRTLSLPSHVFPWCGCEVRPLQRLTCSPHPDAAFPWVDGAHRSFALVAFHADDAVRQCSAPASTRTFSSARVFVMPVFCRDCGFARRILPHPIHAVQRDTAFLPLDGRYSME